MLNAQSQLYEELVQKMNDLVVSDFAQRYAWKDRNIRMTDFLNALSQPQLSAQEKIALLTTQPKTKENFYNSTLGMILATLFPQLLEQYTKLHVTLLKEGSAAEDIINLLNIRDNGGNTFGHHCEGLIYMRLLTELLDAKIPAEQIYALLEICNNNGDTIFHYFGPFSIELEVEESYKNLLAKLLEAGITAVRMLDLFTKPNNQGNSVVTELVKKHPPKIQFCIEIFSQLVVCQASAIKLTELLLTDKFNGLSFGEYVEAPYPFVDNIVKRQHFLSLMEHILEKGGSADKLLDILISSNISGANGCNGKYKEKLSISHDERAYKTRYQHKIHTENYIKFLIKLLDHGASAEKMISLLNSKDTAVFGDKFSHAVALNHKSETFILYLSLVEKLTNKTAVQSQPQELFNAYGNYQFIDKLVSSNKIEHIYLLAEGNLLNDEHIASLKEHQIERVKLELVKLIYSSHEQRKTRAMNMAINPSTCLGKIFAPSYPKAFFVAQHVDEFRSYLENNVICNQSSSASIESRANALYDFNL